MLAAAYNVDTHTVCKTRRHDDSYTLSMTCAKAVARFQAPRCVHIYKKTLMIRFRKIFDCSELFLLR